MLITEKHIGWIIRDKVRTDRVFKITGIKGTRVLLDVFLDGKWVSQDRITSTKLLVTNTEYELAPSRLKVWTERKKI